MEINKCIIPASGVGSRFLPFTKSVPKEMLPLLNKPLIHYIVEEAIRSELKHMFFIENQQKSLISDYFDTNTDLTNHLADHNQGALLENIKRLVRQASYTFIRQAEPQGTGHAVLQAKHCIEKEFFCIALPNYIIDEPEPVLKQLMRLTRQEKASTVAVFEVQGNEVPLYSIAKVKKAITPLSSQLVSITDNPRTRDINSTLALAGRYILSSRIFAAIEYLNTHSEKDEISINDAITHMIHEGERVLTYKIHGPVFVISTPLDLIKATVMLGLKDPVLAPQIRDLLALEKDSIPSPAFTPARPVEKRV
ncbi:MAG: UDP-glucose pyrophosphorylase [candidate division TM6 bacterium GW2011_GWE2_42_60]|nr:MAG: UDP-glucose pyrophosphorylase [candidate division TM6 bacterium GW2011_GWE2_42_60]HBY06085.1 hypothetical protein [Candidatus Dependentiae bacterium]